MPHEIRPLSTEDLPDLGRFLAEGFHAPEDAPFASADVLRWKYLEPRGAEAGDAPRSLLARDAETGRIVGHVGVCPGRWHGGGLPTEGVSTAHMMDWLSSEAGAGVGATLMRRVHQASETQFGLGGSASGRGVIDRGGYGLAQQVPVALRVLRPWHRWKEPGRDALGRLLRVAKDAIGRVARPARRPAFRVELRPVAVFDATIQRVFETYATRAVFTTREPDLLNWMLRYPRGGMTGWRIVSGGTDLGFALLAVVPQAGGIRLGRIAECTLADVRPEAWHAAIHALTGELGRQGADLAQAFASTPWTTLALKTSGYAVTHTLEFRLRDRRNLLPKGAAFHLTPLEADYAYL